MRNEMQLYPDFTAEIELIRAGGITEELLTKIIAKHAPNATYNRKLYDRYRVIDGSLPIFDRRPRFNDGKTEKEEINNKINNDFFGEIVDFKTGFFAGKPIAYSYSNTEEAESKGNVEKAAKVLTDFITRNNMFGVDMEVTKFASIYGYAGRLFYIDTEGVERVIPVHGFETIILSTTNISEPEYAIRIYKNTNELNIEEWTAEFYDATTFKTYKGTPTSLTLVEEKRHMFDFCPLQGIANNEELMGDAEKVLQLIDDYDKVISDNSNELESNVHAHMIFDGVKITDEEIRKGNKTGSYVLPPKGTQTNRSIYWLTKEIDDAFTEHHLERLEDNIYRFSKTPNLADETFGAASGISLKFKLHGLETKCGMFEAKMMNAAQYMWKLLAASWNKRGHNVDPLQIVMNFKRNFPLDTQSEATTVQTLINAGIPKEVAFSQLSFVDDVDYVLEVIAKEKEDVQDMYPNNEGDGDE